MSEGQNQREHSPGNCSICPWSDPLGRVSQGEVRLIAAVDSCTLLTWSFAWIASFASKFGSSKFPMIIGGQNVATGNSVPVVDKYTLEVR